MGGEGGGGRVSVDAIDEESSLREGQSIESEPAAQVEHAFHPGGDEPRGVPCGERWAGRLLQAVGGQEQAISKDTELARGASS